MWETKSDYGCLSEYGLRATGKGGWKFYSFIYFEKEKQKVKNCQASDTQGSFSAIFGYPSITFFTGSSGSLHDGQNTSYHKEGEGKNKRLAV